MEEKIDFVILWVDGNDKKWQEEKDKYSPNKANKTATSANRFRDWNTLKYWFRGVEKYASWVNKIYFVTYGHLPDFLNINHPKLEIINHKDYIPNEFLPLFNSSAIEIGINKINNLEEKFVLFNDDMYILKKIEPTIFFKKGLPCDEYEENVISPSEDIFSNLLFNNVAIINKFYQKKEVHKQNKIKIFNLKYGLNNIRTMLLLPNNSFTGFYNPHLPQAFLKSYFDKAWNLAPNECLATQKNRFRSRNDVTQYLCRYLQLVEGNFFPRNSNVGKYIEIRNQNIDAIYDFIIKQKSKLVCLNDVTDNNDFENNKKILLSAFDKILPDKSSFEL